MKKIEAFVYTSTIYSNCNHLNLPLKEEIIRLPFPADRFTDALKKGDSAMLQELVAYCKPDWPNTYTFSKCLAENVIMDNMLEIPVAIIRPSIVIFTWKQPMPGYVEENSGICALSIGAGKGFIKVFQADPNNRLNMVPVDITANTHVLAAWSVGTKRCASPFVINCTANENLHVKFREFTDMMTQMTLRFPFPKSFEQLSIPIIVTNKYLYYILSAYYHYLPAIVLDGMLRILGKKPRLYSLYRFFDTTMSCLKFFMFTSFEYERKNFEYLGTLIQPEDRKDLSLDFSDVTLSEKSLSVPEGSPFYDWKKDRKSQSERQRIAQNRHRLIKAIQWMFLMTFCLLIYWVFSRIFL
ncbi:unnamed protein product [Larinioides sclopetarius]|uniref:Fatty acyl-CoA reductase n=1 Tax=Larinioides sclopetarius TaxID=280406 RepID=A0AAV2AJP5_9ARAC